MTEEKLYDAIDPQIKKKYNKRFIRSICAIDDLLEKKRYIYDINETGKNGNMEQLINLLNNLHEDNQQLKEKLTKNKKQKTQKQEKKPNTLQDIKELLILNCKIQLNAHHNKIGNYEDWNTIKQNYTNSKKTLKNHITTPHIQKT